jgi:hypothetical protein
MKKSLLMLLSQVLKSHLKMGTRVTLREADRISKTVCRSEMDSNPRFR